MKLRSRLTDEQFVHLISPEHLISDSCFSYLGKNILIHFGCMSLIIQRRTRGGQIQVVHEKA